MKFNCAYTELVDLHKLQPNPRNPNEHPEEQIERLSKIIDYQGQRSPIVVSNRSGFITKGHGRLMALQLLGWTQAAVDYQDYESEAQEFADITADNAIAEWSQLDITQIQSEFEAFSDELDLDMLGLKDLPIPELEEIEAHTDEDEIPEVIDPIAKRGDVWLLGDHRVMCGDSTMIDDVEKLMNGEKADMVFTDPPYGYSYESNYQSKHEMLKNDDVILDFLPVAESFMEKNSAIYLCTSHQVVDRWKPLLESSFKYKNMIIWKKNNWSMGDLKGSFAGQHEIILFGHKGKVSLEGKRDTDIWEFKRTAPELHPTQKTIELIEYAVTKITCNRVLDLFLGSGSTLIACEKTNRKCYGMELDEKYCDVIINRWQNYTDKKATLESTGETYNALNQKAESIKK